LQNSFSTSFPPHFPLTTSPNPTNSLSSPWPAMCPRGDTSPPHFCKKTLHFHHNLNLFTKIPTYKFLFICKSLFFSLSLQQEKNSSIISFFFNQTLAPRTPNFFTSTSRSQGIQLGLHQGTPSSTNTPQSNIKDKFFNLKLQSNGSK